MTASYNIMFTHVGWLCIKCECHSVFENNYFVLRRRLNGHLHIPLPCFTVKLCYGFAVKSMSIIHNLVVGWRLNNDHHISISWFASRLITLHCSWALFLDMTGRLSQLHVEDTPFSWSDLPNTWTFVHSDQVPICIQSFVPHSLVECPCLCAY